MIIKIATNALMRNWNLLSPASKLIAKQNGMLRSKRTYLTGLIKGNNNIKKQVEEKIKTNILYDRSNKGTFHSSVGFLDKKIENPIIYRADYTNRVKSFDIKPINKDVRTYEALVNRHELREISQAHNNLIDKSNNSTIRGIFANPKREIVASHSSARIPLLDIVDANKIPHPGSKPLLFDRYSSGELQALERFTHKDWRDIKPSDAKKLVKREAIRPDGYVWNTK